VPASDNLVAQLRTWLKRTPLEMWHTDATELDRQLVAFATSGAHTISLTNLDSRQRLAVHTRCGSLGFSHESLGHHEQPLRTVVVKRPSGWVFDPTEAPATLPPLGEFAQLPSNSVETKRKRETNEFSCADCRQVLIGVEALICGADKSYAQPRCQACLDADPRTCARKCIPAIEFWYPDG